MSTAATENGATFAERPRNYEVSRVEALSDAVLGFAITLIVVSLDVPRTYAELMTVMRGLPVFAICFALLLQIWYHHYRFFRRYGLQDGTTIALNSTLLFVVLFYVYPLKFLFNEAFGIRAADAPPAFHGVAEVRWTYTLYGAGFCAVFLLLAAMYGHALRSAARLELSEIERFDARSAIIAYAGAISVGILSIVLAHTLSANWLSLPGFCYCLLGLSEFIVGATRGAQRRARFDVRAIEEQPDSAEGVMP